MNLNLYKIYLKAALTISIFIGILLIIDVSATSTLFDEDGVMELTQVAIGVVSMMAALILAVKGYIGKKVWKFWLGLSGLSFLYIGESLSWGERIFDLKMPVVAGVTFDALHDILAVSIGIIKKTRDFIIDTGILDPKSIAIILGSFIGIAAIIYISVKIIVKRKKEISDFFKVNLRKPPFGFLFIAIILILVAMIIDEDNLVGFPHKEIVDEGLELLAIVAFLFSCICGFIGKRWGFAKNKSL